MPRSKYQIYIHLIWSTKQRETYITSNIETTIHNIIREKCRKFNLEPLAIGNIADHIHLLVSINPNIKIKDFVAEVKGATAYYINHESGNSLYWQDGYGCFSIGRSELKQVREYVLNQPKHHEKQKSLIDELENC